MFGLVLVVIILIIICSIQYYRDWTLDKHFVGPMVLPLVGNLLTLLMPQEKIFEFGKSLIQKYGENVRLWLGFQLRIFITNIEDVKFILNSKTLLTKGDDYKFLRPWLREGLIISDGKKWAQKHKIIAPAFHFKNMKIFVTIFQKQSKIFVEKLMNSIPMDDINLDPLISLFSLDVICESAMGVNLNAQHADSEYVQSVQRIIDIIFRRLVSPYRFDFIFKFSSLGREHEKTLKILHEFGDKIIKSRRQELLKSNEYKLTSEEVLSEIKTESPMNFLDTLLTSEIDGKPLSNIEIQEEVDNIIFAGYISTSFTINLCLYSLAMHSRVQRKVYQEINEIIGSDIKKSISFSELNKFHYLECVINETLRMYPPILVIGRKFKEESIINGKRIPAGTSIGISPMQLGSDEKTFKNPSDFLPERFMENSDGINSFNFIPFSAGPRACIGQKFAILEIKSFLIKFLQYYEIEISDKNEDFLLAMILSNKQPIKFNIKRRINNNS